MTALTPGFWITNITVAGHPTKPDSTVSFAAGLNVICGPSNTGKSWVLQAIDYLFGQDAKEFMIDENTHYTEVRMSVRTHHGALTLTRPIGKGQNTVTVSSTDPRVDSGDYKRQSNSAKASLLSSVWLSLIGYDNPAHLKVISNKDFAVKSFTWRTFWHALYADEDRVSTKRSILLPTQNTAKTGFQCALASLLTGRDYAAYARDESTETKSLKNNAIINYLSPLPGQIKSKIDNIDNTIGTDSEEDLQGRINELSKEVEQVMQRIDTATTKGQRIVERLQGVREAIAETNSLRSRYQELAASYQARIDRFGFVEQGHHLLSEHPEAVACPVCEHPVDVNNGSHLPAPDPRERDTLRARLIDLQHTLQRMNDEQTPLEEERRGLEAEAAAIEQLIRGELQPELSSLTAFIDNHNALIAMRAEREELFVRLKEIEEELAERRNRTFTKGNFNPLDEYPDEFWADMSTGLLNTLEACAFPRLGEAMFSRELFDAVVNKKNKAKQGQGYRSFVNTAVMLALRSYLASDKAKHNPGLLVIDTPLLGLDDPQMDPEFQEARETIPLALYEHLITIQEGGQIIIADNTKSMPDIDWISDRCNLVVFTKREGEGRYGFLLETQDGDLTDPEESDET